tara:strand:+ start:110 stop:862 length:753 start_codon:yes stop_codon:yes gene_type:complete
MVQEDNKPIKDEVLETPILEQEPVDDVAYDEITNPGVDQDIDDTPNQEEDAVMDDPTYLRTDPKVVGYDTIDQQEIMYDYILSNFNPVTDSILDLGCGRGDFLRHIEEAYQVEVNYKGVDMNPQLIEVAQELSPTATFTESNWFNLDGNYSADWVVNIQSSTLLYEDPGEDFDPTKGLRNTITKMLELADQGIVISLLSTLAPDIYDENYLVYDPIETLDWALNEYGAIGGNVKLDHSMADAVFTLTIYK